ncbi:MAG: hypothetical protein GY835_19615, partial [bacterium]|nr:hypothetical protein [bacterium]
MNGNQSGTWNPELMKATGVGTQLDLSSISSIDAGFTSTGNDHTYQQISALDGGVVDLSGVQTITGPATYRDDVRLIVDPGSEAPATTKIELTGLQRIETLYTGYSQQTRFDVRGGATQSLPALAEVSHVEFAASGGSAITAPSLSQIVDSTFILTEGSQFSDGSAPATYSSTGIWKSWDPDGYSMNGNQSGTWNPELMKATGVGTQLDLSSI